ncbi:MAG: hypothetical protein WD638_04315 [Nitriliruptoraceae bacterium]
MSTGPSPIIDWSRTARRLRMSFSVLGVAVVVVFTLASVIGGRVSWPLLGELIGLALLAAFVLEVVVVGGSALRGMLTAGERGERLARDDVSLIPPQLLRRARGQVACGPTGCAVPDHDHHVGTSATGPGLPDPAADPRAHG